MSHTHPTKPTPRPHGRPRHARQAAFTLGVALATAASAGAQRAQPAGLTLRAAPRIPPHVGGADTSPSRAPSTRGPALITRRDAALGVALTVGAAAAGRFDRALAVESQDQESQSNPLFGPASSIFRTIGDPGALIVATSMYGVGRLTHRARTADVGLHLTEAIVVSGATTGLIKGIAGRARPYVVGDSAPGDFRLGRGFRRGSDYSAFPSGHTTVAFAAASAGTAEAGRLWPGSARFVGPVLYAGAAGVGLSRMYNDKHWASDVIAGAAVGTLVGRAVVRYQHGHPGTRLDRWLLHTSVVPADHGGVAATWTLRP